MGCRITRKVACILYPIITILLLGVCSVGIGNVVLSALTVAAFIISILVLLCPCCDKRLRAGEEKPDPEKPVPIGISEKKPLSEPLHDDSPDLVSEEIPPPKPKTPPVQEDKQDKKRPKPKKRLLYLDQIKSILTVVVIIHHTTSLAFGLSFGNYYNAPKLFVLALTGLDQGYFMPIFFFISAYFTPTSHDRKGTRVFLRDKFKRLGIPFVLYTLALGPALGAFIKLVIMRDSSYNYFPDAGPTWFLGWLLIFNLAYVFIIDGLPVQPPPPSFCVMVAIGLITGVIQAPMIPFVPNCIFMPITFGSLPFNILFFIAGVKARRGDWLQNDLAALSSSMRLAARCTFVFTACVYIGLSVLVYMLGGGFFALFKNSCGEKMDKGASDPLGPTIGWALGTSANLGMFCMATAVVLFDFARLHWDFTGPISKFFAESSYAAYVLQAVVIIPVTWSYHAILRTSGIVDITFQENTNKSTTCMPDAYIWLGMLYIGVVSLIIIFPFAFVIRRLPGFDQVF